MMLPLVPAPPVSTPSVTRARRSRALLWLIALAGGLFFAAIHVVLTYVALVYMAPDRFEPVLLLPDVAILVLVLVPATWYIRSLTAERQRHAAQVALLDVVAEPRNIGDAARNALAALVRHRIADAGVIALIDEQDDTQRVFAAVGYPEAWMTDAPVIRYTDETAQTISRDRKPHPWVEPLGRGLGKRPWVARIPITSNRDVIGMLMLVARKGGALRDPLVRATIATQVGAALDHAALYEAAYQRERDLEGDDRRRRDFMGELSHEIRTPLMSIQAFADLLRLDTESLDDAADELLSSLTIGVDRLNRLVTDLIDLGRSGGQEFKVHVAEVVGVEALRAAEALMRPAVLLRRQTVVCDVPTAPLYVLADAHRLEQVILAVLSNANQHAPAASEITMTARRTEDGRVRIEIRDHGTGIARDDRERIFEPYYRVRGPGGESVPGSGLGLAVTRRVVGAQGGRIWVEACEDGPGARFCIELRAAPVHG